MVYRWIDMIENVISIVSEVGNWENIESALIVYIV